MAGLLGLAVLAACVSGGPSASESPLASRSPTAASPSAPTSAEPSPGAFGWLELTTSGATPPREDHTWTLDPDRRVAYLFGGREGGLVHGDLWAYDLASDTWQELSATGPAARFGHNAAWVPGTGLVIFAGQGGGSTFFNDLWAYDPQANAWRMLPASGSRPVARYGSCAALAPDGRLWISHGFTSEGSRFADTRAYDFTAESWADETPVGDVPMVRCLHGCWWTDDGRLVLYGGQTTGATALGDLWAYSVGPRPGTGEWTQAGGPLPPARNLYAAARWGAATVVSGARIPMPATSATSG